MADKYCSAKFKCGEDLDAALEAALCAASNKACSEAAAARAEAAANEALRVENELNADSLREVISQKGDNLEFDDEEGLLYLTSGGERIGDGIKVATSGGGGGGGESNNAVLTFKNTTGWIYKTIAYGAACPISMEWSSLEDGLATGDGVLKITVNDTVKHTAQVEQGAINLDIGPWLSAGSCAVKANITDVYGNGRTLSYNITAVALSLASYFDANVANTGDITYPYTPTFSA